jgi:WYL domain
MAAKWPPRSNGELGRRVGPLLELLHDPGQLVLFCEVLTAVAGACRDHQRLRFDYRDHDGLAGLRSVEPHRLVHDRGRRYLVAWDVDRDDWRTFRADRIQSRIPTGPRFVPRDPPDGDVVTYLLRGVGSAMWRLGMLDVDFEVDGPPELVEQLDRLADRYRRAIAGTGR